MANGYQVKTRPTVPVMSDEWVAQISARYIELFETVTGQQFQPADPSVDPQQRIETNISKSLSS